jgi:hypothetical protein
MISADIKAKLTAKAAPMLLACIGETKTMRLGPKLTQSGVIVAAEIDSFSHTGRAVEVLFRVTLECGSAKARHQFVCRRLPV